jgi:hypothetical protein
MPSQQRRTGVLGTIESPSWSALERHSVPQPGPDCRIQNWRGSVSGYEGDFATSRPFAKAPLYYTDIAEKFAQYDFRTIARAIGHLHATEKLWQDPRGRMCVCGSEFAKAAKDKRRRTTMVPVTTMEEIPVLSGKERAELISRLKAAQARAKAGKAIGYDPETFKQRLVGIYRKGKR